MIFEKVDVKIDMAIGGGYTSKHRWPSVPRVDVRPSRTIVFHHDDDVWIYPHQNVLAIRVANAGTFAKEEFEKEKK